MKAYDIGQWSMFLACREGVAPGECHTWSIESCRVYTCTARTLRLSTEAKLFRALADPTRLAILRSLLARPLRVVDLCGVTGKVQPNVSAHLAVLRDCGFITGEVKGRETFYSISEPEIIDALRATDHIVSKIGHHICACPMLAQPDPASSTQSDVSAE